MSDTSVKWPGTLISGPSVVHPRTACVRYNCRMAKDNLCQVQVFYTQGQLETKAGVLYPTAELTPRTCGLVDALI